ncbi:MAG: BON domain-containing protein [Bryobacteraceae bacterium]
MKRLLAIVLLFGGAIGHAIFAADQKASSSDDRISDQVRMRLATDQDVKGGALEVFVKDGVVTIKGRVDTEKGKNRATRLAKKVKGVKDIDNQLLVGPFK